VKIGNEIKTIVSGIADQYEPQSLIGKKIVVLNNLQPAEFMGVKSEAMLLAAEDNGSVSLLTVMRDIADGSPVH
jgi:methionyl-tRNA synthetase (EC 6.1.1.10)